jgi:hypothetical protein
MWTQVSLALMGMTISRDDVRLILLALEGGKIRRSKRMEQRPSTKKELHNRWVIYHSSTTHLLHFFVVPCPRNDVDSCLMHEEEKRIGGGFSRKVWPTEEWILIVCNLETLVIKMELQHRVPLRRSALLTGPGFSVGSL